MLRDGEVRRRPVGLIILDWRHFALARTPFFSRVRLHRKTSSCRKYQVGTRDHGIFICPVAWDRL